MNELKPCPFCGGEARRIDIDATKPSVPDAGASYIACGRCYACSPIMFGEKTGLEESWNRRAISTIDPEAIRRYRLAIEQASIDLECYASIHEADAKDIDAIIKGLDAAILSAEPIQNSI